MCWLASQVSGKVRASAGARLVAMHRRRRAEQLGKPPVTPTHTHTNIYARLCTRPLLGASSPGERRRLRWRRRRRRRRRQRIFYYGYFYYRHINGEILFNRPHAQRPSSPVSASIAVQTPHLVAGIAERRRHSWAGGGWGVVSGEG